MEASIEALVAKLWTIDGKPNSSLADAGYRRLRLNPV